MCNARFRTQQKPDLWILKSVFPLHTKSNACVCTLVSDIISNTASYDQGYKASSSPGNPHSGQPRGQGPLTRSPHVPTEPQSGSRSIQVQSDWTQIAQSTCSSWWLTHSPQHSLWSPLQLSDGLHQRRIWKKHPSYLPLMLLLIASLFTGQQQLHYWNQTEQTFQLCPSVPPQGQRKSSIFPGHLFIFQSTGCFVCTFYYSLKSSAAIPLLHSWEVLQPNFNQTQTETTTEVKRLLQI